MDQASFPKLSEMEVHLWYLQLDAKRDLIELKTLSKEERERADLFHFEADRFRYAATRSQLRRLLGGYLQMAPERVRIELESSGKPFVRSEKKVFFNLSHSHEMALLAFAINVNVGVDLEFVRKELELEELADRFFSIDERAAMRSVSVDKKTRLFYEIWSAKEACLKASGMGLQIPLDHFSVVSPSGDLRKKVSFPIEERKRTFRLYEVLPLDGYGAALAAESEVEMAIRFFRI